MLCDQGVGGRERDVGGEQNEAERDLEKRQTTMALATPSIALSSPFPISATEPARSPAAVVAAPSKHSHARESNASRRARRAARSQSPAGAGRAASALPSRSRLTDTRTG